MSVEGTKLATRLWLDQEKAAGEAGLWVSYLFCSGCGDFRQAVKHTDAQLVDHFGGELYALSYYDRQRVACNHILKRCQECFNVHSRTGFYPEALLTDAEAERLRDWVNEGGLHSVL